MSPLSSARAYTATLLTLRKFLRQFQPLSLERAEAQIKDRLQTREQRFLELMDRCIWNYQDSPYLPLLKAADCEAGDVASLVRNEGLEPALRRLRDEGVYFSFEEFKGRTSVERGGLSFTVRTQDFDNPTTARQLSNTSGGSTGARTKVWTNLVDTERWDSLRVVVLAAHRLTGMPWAIWGTSSLSALPAGLKVPGSDLQPDKKFVTRVEKEPNYGRKYMAAATFLGVAARAGGMELPKPEWIDPLNPLPIARWAEKKLRSHGECRVDAGVGKAVRIAISATENGIDLSGVSCVGTGEPATPAKVEAITRSGARWISYYSFAEGGGVGYACANPLDGSDVHLFGDRYGLIQIPRRVPGTDVMVDAFNLTNLSDTAPKVLLNVEIDDFGIVEQRDCGCPLGQLGYDTHIREIFSFQKLTGEGVTLVGNDLVRILEEVLPQRFGGSPLDYQLVEEEDENSLTRISLVIDPRVRIEDESQVIAAVIDELKTTDAPSSMGSAIWERFGTFRIIRKTPMTSGREKLMPLYVSRSVGATA